MKRMEKPLFSVAVATMAAAALIGCNKQGAQQGAAMPPTQVDVVSVKVADAVIRTELSGRTTAYQVAEIRPQVSGIIVKRLFTEGASVKAGDSLYQIDPAIYEAALASAKASVLQAQANLAKAAADAKRSANLVKSRAVSQSQDDSTQASYKVALANLEVAKASQKTAEVNLAYTKVKSPISGRVDISNVTPGALVTANQSSALTNVQQLDPIYVDVHQSYAKMAELRNRINAGEVKTDEAGNAQVRLILDSGAEYAADGKLIVKDATVDEATGMVRIRAVFPNPNGDLLPGQYVRASLVEGIQKGAVILDQRAVMRDYTGKPYCFVVDESNKVQSRQLVLSDASGSNWIVKSGLKEGERVIVEGIQKVRAGSTVSISSGAAQGAAAAQ